MKKSKTKPFEKIRHGYPPWGPRIWSGMLPPQYWQLLSENRFSIHPLRLPMAGLVSVWSLLNTGFGAIQKLAYGSAIEKTALEVPPVFIVGHWRSGTTLLHELVALDENRAYPNTFDTFLPNHLLVSGPVIRPVIRMLLPKKRPMDDMASHVDSPQEDDFALTVLGADSYYRRVGFPHSIQDYDRLLDGQNLNEQQLETMERCLKYFYRELTYRYQKGLVLKSPPHTGRIRLLSKWFPGAKFIHISRHPHSIVPSTMRLWKVIDDVSGFQVPAYDDEILLENIHHCQNIMYRSYFRDREKLAANQLAEVKFEKLIRSPAETIAKIYAKLELGDSTQVAEATGQYFAQRSSHKKNKHDTDHLVESINEHWAHYMEQFGFSKTR